MPDSETWDQIFQAVDNPVDWLVGKITDRSGRANEQIRDQARQVVIELLGAFALAYLALRIVDSDVDLGSDSG